MVLTIPIIWFFFIIFWYESHQTHFSVDEQR